MGFLPAVLLTQHKVPGLDVGSPLLKTPWRPALLLAVTFRHVLRECAHPRDGFTRMAPRPAVAGDRPEAGYRPHGAPVADPHTGARHRVMVLLIADVIVDADLDRFGWRHSDRDAPVVTPVPGGPTAQTPRVGYRAAA